MNPNLHEKRLPTEVQTLLQRVRQLLRRYIGLQAVFIVASWVLFLYWFGGLIDYLPVTSGSSETPRWVRTVLLAAMLAGSVWTVFFWCLPRLFARIQDRSIALLIERHYPELQNRLVTAVELQPGAGRLSDKSRALGKAVDRTEFDVSNPDAHDAMLVRVQASLAEQIRDVEPKKLFNWQPVWAAGTTVALVTIVSLLAFAGMPSWMELWSKRLFTLSDTPWPRTAELRVDGVQVQLPAFSGQLIAERVTLPFINGKARVPSGSTSILQVSANAESKKVPEVCTLFYRGADNSRGRANLRRIGGPAEGWQRFVLDGPPLDGLAADMDVSVTGLDARLDDLQLQVVTPTVLSNVRIGCEYPTYLLESLTRAAQEMIPYRSGVRIPQGTNVTLVGEASSELSSVQYVVRSSTLEQAETDEENASLDPSDGLDIRNVEPDGKTFEIPLGKLTANEIVEIRLIDQYGLPSEQIPRYVLTMQEDSVPEVMSKLAGIGNAITADALLPVRGTVIDDHGIAEVKADLARSDNTSISIDIAVPAETDIQVDIDLKKLAETTDFTVMPGDTVGLVVAARDYYDLDESPHVGLGQAQQLSVVTKDDLLVILDRQELELRQRLELIIAELEQLREALSSLSSPSQASQASNRGSSLPVLDTPIEFASFAAMLQEDERVSKEDMEDEEQARQRRMFVLRSQQAVLQGDKTEQELQGVADRVDNLREQLLNNRIDSYDRQTRLSEKVHQPLVSLLETEYSKLTSTLKELQSAAISGGGVEKASSAIVALDDVLLRLLEIKENMLDIESFNEIIDLVRSLLEDQEQLLEETEKIQRERILQLLQ